jgi:mono/diheme cytochrome c family protein
MRTLIAGLSVMILAPTVALAAGDPERGRAIAERWCASCHAIGGQSSAVDTAPPFSVLGRIRTPGALHAWLNAPHPPMPDPGLTRRKIDDVTAYLLQQGRQKAD